MLEGAQGSGFGVQGAGCNVEGSRVSEFWVRGPRCRAQGCGFRVRTFHLGPEHRSAPTASTASSGIMPAFGFRVSVLGFRV
jgi:hypothetical protein